MDLSLQVLQEDKVVIVTDNDEESSNQPIPETSEIKLSVTDFTSCEFFPNSFINKVLKKLEKLERNTLEEKEYDDYYFELIILYLFILKYLDDLFRCFEIPKRKTTLEDKLIKKIHKIYNEAIKLYPNKITSYSIYYAFVKNHLDNNEQLITKIFQQIYKAFPEEPTIWLTIAKWYKECNIDIAITFMDDVLKTHKTKDFYLCSIQLKIDYIAKIEAPLEKQKYCTKVISKDVNDYCEYNKNFKDTMDLFNSLQNIKHTVLVQNMIIDKMMEYYRDEVILWTTLAEREKRGVRYGQSYGSNFQNCFATYELGLQYINPKMKMELWSHYLSTVIESKPDNKYFDINSIFMKAFEEDCLDFKFYPKIIPILSKELALKILENGAIKFSKSVDFWLLYLRCIINHDIEEKIHNIFQTAVKHTREKALPLWEMIISHYEKCENERKLKLIYSEGCKEHENISSELKPKYYQWRIAKLTNWL